MCARPDCGNIKDQRPWCPIHGHFDPSHYSQHRDCAGRPHPARPN